MEDEENYERALKVMAYATIALIITAVLSIILKF